MNSTKRNKTTIRISQNTPQKRETSPAKSSTKRKRPATRKPKNSKPAFSIPTLSTPTISGSTMVTAGGLLAIIAFATAAINYGTKSVDGTAEYDAPTFAETSPIEAVAAAPEPAPTPEPLFPKEEQLEVGKGDTLIEMLTDTGVSHEEAFEAVAALGEVYDPRRLNRGQKLDVMLEASDEGPEIPSLSELTMPISAITTIELRKIEDGKFAVEKVDVPTTAYPTYSKLPIKGSLYVTARKANLTPKLILELMKGFAYDVDFQRDVQRGHTLEVVADTLKTKNGDIVGSNNLRYAKLTMGKKKVAIYRYTDTKGHTDYYNAKGESLKKSLLRTPVDGARISSRYGKRKHPILGYRKMHRGVDFAAPTGTPIYAAGDGVVDYKGRKGGYGNYLRIKHNGTYSTAYAHIHKFARSVRKGKRVRQGQVVAYVGSTGRSTGPHLHYEVLKHNKQVNPSKVQDFNSGVKLAGKEMKKFKGLLAEVKTVISDTPKTVAQAN